MAESTFQRWLAAGQPEPVAADENVDGETCNHADCEESADYRVQWDNGHLTYHCQSCSRSNRIYAKENDLLTFEVSVDA